MSEEQFFATLGFETEDSAKDAQDVLTKLHKEPSEYQSILPGTKDPELFIDTFCGSKLFGKIIMADWFSGDSIKGGCISKNLKLLNPKYQSLEHYRDSGSSTRTGYISDKKTNYRVVLDTLATESDEIGYTLALLESKTKKVKDFLDNGHDPHASSLGKNALLHRSVQYSNPLMLTLIEAGVFLSPLDNKGRTPLIQSVCDGNEKISKALLEAGANANFCVPSDGNTAAHDCSTGVEKRHQKMIKLLCKHGADLNISNHKGYTPLLRLMDYHHPISTLESLKLYMKLGADIHYYHEGIGNALWLATENDLPDCLEYLLAQGAELKKPIPKPLEHLPEDPEVTEILSLFEEHEKLTNSLLAEGPISDIYWPDHDKTWLKQRKQLWKYNENSIKEWFSGNIKAATIKELKKYFIQGRPFSKDVQIKGVLPALDYHHPFSTNDELKGLGPLLLTWLHPSSDDKTLKKLMPEDFDIYTIRYYFFSTISSKSTLCGVAGPRMKTLAPLFMPYCYLNDLEQNRSKMIQFFIKKYCESIPSFLGKGKTLGNPFEYLFDDFINVLSISFDEGITLKNKDIELRHKGKTTHTTIFKHMIESVESFSIDGVPYEKVDPATQFVSLFKEKSTDDPLKNFIQKYR